MQTLAPCTRCLFEHHDMSDPGYAEMDDDGIVEVTCPRGHHCFIVRQAPRFEVLFDFGALALRDGFYREAVTSFNVSLERAYEFLIREVTRPVRQGVAFKDAWKGLKKQSERQLGAFLILYLQETGKVWEHIPEDDIGFRNRCVHQGYLPKRREAIDFGKLVLEAINKAFNDLENKAGRFQFNEEHAERFAAAEKRAKKYPGAPVLQAGSPTILNQFIRTVPPHDALKSFLSAVAGEKGNPLWHWTRPAPGS